MPRFLFIVTPKAVGILPAVAFRCAGVGYSMAQADVYSYVPSESVYDTPAGAYIMHEPPGLLAKQLVAAPADV